MPEARPEPPAPAFSRRRVLEVAGGVGILAVTHASCGSPPRRGLRGPTSTGTGTTPEQVHLTWAFDAVNNPTNSVVVTWLQPMPSIGGSVVYAPMTTGLSGVGTAHGGGQPESAGGWQHQRRRGGLNPSPAAGSLAGDVQRLRLPSYQDLIDGEYVYAYSAVLTGPAPGTAYAYSISDGNGNSFPTIAAPAGFTTAPTGPGGRIRFTFTSYGDLATPDPLAAGSTGGDTYSYTTWSESSPNSYPAVNAVRRTSSQLFHLLNGDLCYADKNPTVQPEVWRDFGMNVQRSAMNRPWMPCLGNHETEIANGYSSPLPLPPARQRCRLPDNFYSFQVGSVLSIALDGNDVVYQDSAPYAAVTTVGAHQTLPVGATGFDRYYTGTPTGTYPTGTYPTDANLKVPAGSNSNGVAPKRPGPGPPQPAAGHPAVAHHHHPEHRGHHDRLDRGAGAQVRDVVVARQRL